MKNLSNYRNKNTISFGTKHEDSDIDLYIVTKDEFIPQSFRDRMAITTKISDAIDTIRDQAAVDLIVHKSMSNKFKELNSSFYNELLSK